jgi:predicted enzyme related to lactoylglutathione lyase
MGNKVGWFEIAGGDGKKLQEFYGELFGWSLDANNPMNYGMVQADDAGLGGGVGAAPPGGASHLTVYIEVDDLQAALDKAEKLGGKTVNPPMDVPEGPSIAHFADPEGNMVGLMKAGSGSMG